MQGRNAIHTACRMFWTVGSDRSTLKIPPSHQTLLQNVCIVPSCKDQLSGLKSHFALHLKTFRMTPSKSMRTITSLSRRNSSDQHSLAHRACRSDGKKAGRQAVCAGTHVWTDCSGSSGRIVMYVAVSQKNDKSDHSTALS